MKVYKHILVAVSFIIAIAFSFSCKKKFEPVPLKTMSIDSVTTIAKLRALYVGINIKFSSNTVLYGVVTMDESSGNIYKQVYLRDSSGTSVTNGYGAISLHFLHSSSGFLSQGDYIAVNLNGATLDKSAGNSLQLDSIDVQKSITHIQTGLNPVPLNVTLSQLASTAFDGQLVKLSHVEFISTQVGLPYAVGQNPPAAPISYNRIITDTLANSLVTYNSGYANFAYTPANNITIPHNSGSMIGIANLYLTMQFTIRSFADIQLTSPYIPIALDVMNQQFSTGLANNVNVVLPDWQNLSGYGTSYVSLWRGLSYGTAPYNYTVPAASAYNSTDLRNDMWLITPAMKYHGSGIPKYLDFDVSTQHLTGINARQLSVLVSNSFDGVNLNSGNWVDISSQFPFIVSSNTLPIFKWASTGQYNSSPQPITFGVNPCTFYVAFRYQGRASNSDSAATFIINHVTITN